MSSRLNGKPTRIGEEMQVRILSVRIKLREIEVDVTYQEIEKGVAMRAEDILMAFWEINPDREIDKIDINIGEIVFSDGEVMTIKYGIKRYNCEILSKYYADDPETYPDFVRNAFGYFDLKRQENESVELEEIVNDAANLYSENKDDYEFIWDCFRVSYPELAREFGEV